MNRAAVVLVLPVVLVLAASAGLVGTPAAYADGPRPSVVFLLADDLGYGDLACYGHQTIRTPHLDRLAAEGVRFTHCYSAAPVCSPSRAGILTGRNPNRLGVRDWIPANSGTFLRTEEVTVAELLKDAGYRTGFVGKWHLASRMDGSEPTPAGHGFDSWFATQNNANPSHQHPKNFVRDGKRVGPLEGNSSALIVDEAIKFLDGVKPGEPFALFVWFHAPHEPVAVPPAYEEAYADVVADPTARTYYGAVTLMDEQVGRLMAALDGRKLRDDTLVMFTSDNGPEPLKRYRGAERSHGSAGGLRGMKLELYEGGYRVPGIVRWPRRVAAGTVSDEPVCGVDVLPTLAEAAGVTDKLPADRPLDGASILPAFDGKSIERKTPLYWQYDKAIGGPWRVALRRGPWKLLADAKLSEFALFNLENDPAEASDLADAQPEQRQALAAELARMHREINTPAEGQSRRPQ